MQSQSWFLMLRGGDQQNGSSYLNSFKWWSMKKKKVIHQLLTVFFIIIIRIESNIFKSFSETVQRWRRGNLISLRQLCQYFVPTFLWTTALSCRFFSSVNLALCHSISWTGLYAAVSPKSSEIIFFFFSFCLTNEKMRPHWLPVWNYTLIKVN